MYYNVVDDDQNVDDVDDDGDVDDGDDDDDDSDDSDDDGDGDGDDGDGDDDDDDDDDGDGDGDGDDDAASILCEPAQSKCTWTCHKRHFVQKITGKGPDASDTTSIEHRSLTVTVRTPQCGHAVWGINA